MNRESIDLSTKLHDWIISSLINRVVESLASANQ